MTSWHLAVPATTQSHYAEKHSSTKRPIYTLLYRMLSQRIQCANTSIIYLHFQNSSKFVLTSKPILMKYFTTSTMRMVDILLITQKIFKKISSLMYDIKVLITTLSLSANWGIASSLLVYVLVVSLSFFVIDWCHCRWRSPLNHLYTLSAG